MPSAISSSLTSTTSSTRSRTDRERAGPCERRIEAIGDRSRFDRDRLARPQAQRSVKALSPARRRRRRQSTAEATPGDQATPADRERRWCPRQVCPRRSRARASRDRPEAPGRRTDGRTCDRLPRRARARARAPRPRFAASRSTSAPYARVAATLSGFAVAHMNDERTPRPPAQPRTRPPGPRSPRTRSTIPARLLLVRQRRELREHPARLERARLLEELGLQEHVRPEGTTRESRRAMDVPADKAGRALDVVAVNGQTSHGAILREPSRALPV